MTLYFIRWASSFKFLILSTLSTFVIIAYYNFSNGFIISLDTNTFSKWSDILINLDFNFYQYYVQNTYTALPFFYTIPIVLVSISKIFFGSNWENVFFSINIFCLFLALVFFVKSLLVLKIRPIIISFTIPMTILSADWMVWPRWILTDTIFSFLVILAIYLLVKCIAKNKINYFSLILIIIAMLLTRPASIPVILFIIVFILIFKFKMINRKNFLLFFIFIGFILTPVFSVFLHFLIELIFYESFRGMRILNWAKEGIIIWDRPDTWVAPPVTFSDFLNFYFLRLVNFFNPYAISFSKIHIFLNFFQFLYIILSLILWLFFIGKNKLLDQTIFIVLFLTLFVSAFHSFILLDYDWRYRYPIIMPLMMVLPITIEIILKKFEKLIIKNY